MKFQPSDNPLNFTILVYVQLALQEHIEPKYILPSYQQYSYFILLKYG